MEHMCFVVINLSNESQGNEIC